MFSRTLMCRSAALILCLSFFISGCAKVQMVKHRVDNMFSEDPLHGCHCWPPMISQVQSNSVTSTGATINFTTDGTWNAPTPTNNGGTGQIRLTTNPTDLSLVYPNTAGTLYPLGSSYTTLPLLESNTITLTGLSSDTTYYYCPESWAKEQSTNDWYAKPHQCVGWGATVGVYSFHTLPATTLYTISGYVTSGGSPLSGVLMTLSGAASDNYATTGSGYYVFTNLSGGNYIVTPSLSGYSFAPTTYTYSPLGADQSNQDFTATYTGASGASATIILSEIGASEIARDSAMIYWRTNVPANSKIEHGLTGDYGDTTPLDATLVTIHSIKLYNLTEDTLYHYRVISSSTGAIPAYSSDNTFRTLGTTTAVSASLVVKEKVLNYPNPCKTRTNFCIPLTDTVDSVQISVYSLSGNKVITITKQGSELSVGTNQVYWDLNDESGSKIGNGLYVYQIIVKKGFTEEKVRKSNLMVIK